MWKSHNVCDHEQPLDPFTARTKSQRGKPSLGYPSKLELLQQAAENAKSRLRHIDGLIKYDNEGFEAPFLSRAQAMRSKLYRDAKQTGLFAYPAKIMSQSLPFLEEDMLERQPNDFGNYDNLNPDDHPQLWSVGISEAPLSKLQKKGYGPVVANYLEKQLLSVFNELLRLNSPESVLMKNMTTDFQIHIVTAHNLAKVLHMVDHDCSLTEFPYRMKALIEAQKI
ncbi:hypothetical protein [uncultured Photobacterium sp.]|uniref:hypothetical protein n=1 Tax=uncultured Photobacterium sp. TaxID=173973 RepID=UPI00260683A8|nr:hypothetical protein [uncultured Photobacterium sp.]